MPSSIALLNDAKTRAGGLTQDDNILMEWMNQEYRETNMQIAKAVPDYFLTSTPFPITAGTSIYDLPADTIRVERFEDANGDRVDETTREDLQQGSLASLGWLFYGYRITGGARRERVRIQPDNAQNATWTLWYIQNPPDLDTSSNVTPAWPVAVHELLTLGILMRWMEQDEQPDRYAEYKNLRDQKRVQLMELLDDRSSGLASTPIVRHPEDYN